MTTKLYLVRHGETDWNKNSLVQGHADNSLNYKGLEQGKSIGNYFANINLAAVYSSPLKRAIETAEFIAKKHQLPVTTHDELIEINFGNWEGLSLKQINEKWPSEFEAWQKKPHNLVFPDGESYADAKKRLHIAIKNLIAKYDNKNIVVVSHGGALRLILLAILNIDLTHNWQFRIKQGAATCISFQNNNNNYAILERLNDNALIY